MRIQKLSCCGDHEPGVDFAEFFGDTALHHDAIERLSILLPGCRAYALQHQFSDRNGWFEPFYIDGLTVPPRIEALNLLVDSFTWLPIAKHVGNIQDLYHEVDPVIRDSPWRGLVRLDTGPIYRGYYKIVFTGDRHAKPPTDLALLSAAFCLRVFAQDEVHRRRVENANAELLAEAEQRIRQSIAQGNVRLALRYLASLITAHLGGNLNRVAVFCNTGHEDSLECVHAHGGDGSAEWARVQHYVATTFRTPAAFFDEVASFGDRPADPYSVAAAGQPPLRVNLRSEGLLAQIWRQNGDLSGLPRQARIAALCSQNFSESTEVHAAQLLPKPLAAILPHDDPWLQSVHTARPAQAAIFTAPGGGYLLPMLSGDQVAALFVFDLRSWGPSVDVYRDAVPGLMLARYALSRFGGLFRKSVSSSAWQRLGV